MQNSFNSENIEFALQVLQHPEYLEKPEVQAWLSVKEHNDLLEELRHYREAGMREKGGMFTDVELQWQQLNRKSTKPYVRFRRMFAKVAAVVILFVSVSVLISYYAWQVEQDNSKLAFLKVQNTGIKLITNKGEEILLGMKENEKKSLPESGNIVIDTMEGRSCLQILKDSSSSSDNYYTLQIPRGGEYMVILDDETRVWLNSESELRYPEVFGKDKREVFLKGEAYFEVKPDERRPFIVITKDLRTRVLGTEFNIQSYPSCVVNVTLVKGSVLVRKNQKQDMDEVLLKPGENVALLGNEFSVEKVDVLKYTAWKEGYFYYDNVRLEDILKDLGRWFDFTVFYQNPETKDYRFKFWANRRETTQEMLQRLNDTRRIRAEMSGETVVITI